MITQKAYRYKGQYNQWFYDRCDLKGNKFLEIRKCQLSKVSIKSLNPKDVKAGEFYKITRFNRELQYDIPNEEIVYVDFIHTLGITNLFDYYYGPNGYEYHMNNSKIDRRIMRLRNALRFESGNNGLYCFYSVKVLQKGRDGQSLCRHWMNDLHTHSLDRNKIFNIEHLDKIKIKEQYKRRIAEIKRMKNLHDISKIR